MGITYIEDKNLSLKAKGLLSIMLDRRKEMSIDFIKSVCCDKETSIRSALNELKENGYLIIIKKYPSETESGRFEYQYIFNGTKV